MKIGIISNLNKFDAAFFGIHPKQVDLMDPQGRLAIEIAYEAVLDAGIHPQALRNTKCGVFLASCFSEAEKNFMFDNLGEGGLALPGYVHEENEDAVLKTVFVYQFNLLFKYIY